MGSLSLFPSLSLLLSLDKIYLKNLNQSTLLPQFKAQRTTCIHFLFSQTRCIVGQSSDREMYILAFDVSLSSSQHGPTGLSLSRMTIGQLSPPPNCSPPKGPESLTPTAGVHHSQCRTLYIEHGIVDDSGPHRCIQSQNQVLGIFWTLKQSFSGAPMTAHPQNTQVA